MKKLFLSAVSTLAIVGVAVAADSTEFGVLYVPSTTTETIVAVPWLASGTGSDTTQDAVKVADFVLTSGLSVNDELKYYNGSDYECWKLVEDGDVKKWVPGTVVTATKVSDTPGSADKRILRGQAIILKRANPGDGFYIMGKPSNAAGEVMLATASSGKAYTLVAPPFVEATNPNDLKWEGIDGSKDSLMIIEDNGSPTTLGYKNSTGKWRYWTGSNWVETKTIPAGKGAWFVTSGTGTKKVSWPKN